MGMEKNLGEPEGKKMLKVQTIIYYNRRPDLFVRNSVRDSVIP